ncbi:glutamate--tRNA ligase [Candidatus Parcubacteria bacterium]|nr:MAG: glutamate--tRNA ligase [Candidatus Parcubacteria bacterium]
MKLKTRFAPSPTGYLHVGSLRTALFDYLFAKKNKGEFALRIEDTDRERFVEDAQEKLLAVLAKMGLEHDGDMMVQSLRLDTYHKQINKLIKDGHAYYCFCSQERLEKLRQEAQAKKEVPKYDGLCRHLKPEEAQAKIDKGESYVVRFKIPENKIVEAKDLVYGKISVKTQDLDDFVILKSDKYPTYHLANVVDDHEMKITHVIRGEEWLPSLPRHILLYQAFGYEPPAFVHLPLLLNPDRSKLSKRQGDVAVEDFLAKGYLSQALINYIALLGWNPGNDQELFTIDQLIKEFSLERINKAGAIFDINKLNWFNAEYIKAIVEQGGSRYQQLVEQTAEFIPEHKDRIDDLLHLFGTRINNLSELKVMSEFLFNLPNYPAEMLIFKKSDREKTTQGLNLALGTLGKVEDKLWQEEKLNTLIQNVAEEHKLSPGDIFWPIRVALSGLEKSPSPVELLVFLGKNESLSRIKQAIAKLG